MSDFAREKALFDAEVDAEASQMVRDGTEPFTALRRAQRAVEQRRSQEAMERRLTGATP